MTEDMREIMKEEIKKAMEVVEDKLNSMDEKIDSHNSKHEADMQEIKPFLRGAAGLGLLWKAFVAIGGLAMAYSAIRGLFFK